jgi:hypothetical protein
MCRKELKINYAGKKFIFAFIYVYEESWFVSLKGQEIFHFLPKVRTPSENQPAFCSTVKRVLSSPFGK